MVQTKAGVYILGGDLEASLLFILPLGSIGGQNNY